MNNNLRIELLGKLVTGAEKTKQLKERRKDYFTEKISDADLDKYIKQGWTLDKKFQSSIRVSKQKPTDIAFEDYTWALFALMGYDFLNENRKFSLPYDKEKESLRKQIDIFAKDAESIILVECKCAETNKKGDFKKELESYKGIIQGLKNSAEALFPGSKPKVKFILATKNYFLSDDDLARLTSIGGIHLNEDNIDYFYSLYDQLGSASKYQFLGSIFHDQEIPDMDTRVPAVEGSMGGHTYYSFAIEPEKLLKIGYVLHRNKANVNMMPTYQRLVKKARLKSVYEFVENGGYFPNSIVLNIDTKKCQFDRANTQVDNTLSRVGVLHLPKKYRSAYIIDGQHRLYGYSNSDYKNKNTIPVVAFLDLSREEQVKLFMQINENQKAVSKDLRNTLNADLLWTSDSYVDQQRALCSRISIFLGENRESPLYNKISIGEDKKIITTQAVENALRRSGFLGKVSKNKIEELGTFYEGDLDVSYEKLKTYLMQSFKYISENLIDEWNREIDGMLLINKGVYGLIMVLNDILKHLKKDGANLNGSIKTLVEDTKTYLDAIINFIKDLDDDSKINMKSSYGAGGETKYWRTFQKSIRDTFPDFQPEGLDEYLKKEEKENNTRAFQVIRDIETHFKEDFKERLEEKFGKMWLKKGLPPKLYEEAHTAAITRNREIENDEDEIEPWDCLYIISYREIALKHWQEIFEKEYTRPGEEKISGGKEEKTKWMFKLGHLRNQNAHSYFVTDEELNFIEEINDWIIKKELRNKYQVSDTQVSVTA